MRPLAYLWLLHAGWLWGQSTTGATLTYTGAPLSVPFPCADADLDWAGLSCQDAACPIYLELDAAAGQGSTLLVAGNFHATAATMQSLLLESDDGGKTWREAFARARGTVLDHIQFYDAQTAWVSGQVVQPLDIDPFFLATADGGKSWERIPLFEEGTPGAILQFAFDTKEHGLALVDLGAGSARYEVYETQSGGRSWSIHAKSADLPKLKNIPDSEWRLRAEPKVFRLEHLEAGHWGPFAAFSIAAAQCKATREELKEPAPPEVPAAPSPKDPQ